jgi:hypothetical protein
MEDQKKDCGEEGEEEGGNNKRNEGIVTALIREGYENAHCETESEKKERWN